MVNIEELIDITEYVTRYMRRRINRCRYNQIRLCMCVCVCTYLCMYVYVCVCIYIYIYI